MSTTTKLGGVLPGNKTILIEEKSGVLVSSLLRYAKEAEVPFKPGVQFVVDEVVGGAAAPNTKIILTEMLK